MNRKLLCLLLFLFTYNTIYAGGIDLKSARKVAVNFISHNSLSIENQLCTLSSDLTIAKNGTALYYIFNISPRGFIIVSGHNAAPPVLGYSLENEYSAESQPENFSLWMDGYAGTIEYLINKNVEPEPGNLLLWQAYMGNPETKNASTATTVGPLIPCTWNQSYPYNYLCPPDQFGSGGYVYAGCVATAMSQVMYYWRYPQQGTGSHGYTWDPYGYLFADFGSTTYKWNEMTNSTSTQNFEMAQLQSQLGISVDMMYSGSGSGAYSENAADALRTYFGYDQSLELVYKDNYAYEDWKTLLRSQIDAGQPMYYHGFGSGGHAFNVDGYQDTLYFHFNWGWGGSYNGYYHLTNLNPGGSSFSEGQGAIINFFPAGNNVTQCNGTDTLTLLAGTLEDGSGPVSPYFDNSACSWLIMPNDTLEYIKLNFQRFDLENGKDFIYIYDGVGTDSPLIGSYTGNTFPPEAVSTSGSMFIQFVSDGTGTSNGWLASYNAKQAQFCTGTTVLTSPSGNFGDGSGSYNYHDNTLCKFEITPENAQSISLTFNELNTAGETDFIAVYDNISHELYTKISGQNNPGTLNYSSGSLMLLFKTDQSVSAPGWNISYTSSITTGLSKISSDFGLNISPNPANDLISVTSDSRNRILAMDFFSAEGRKALSKDLSLTTGQTIHSIDVSMLPRGMYIVKILTEKGVANQKVILN